jgi:hypothetical protein
MNNKDNCPCAILDKRSWWTRVPLKNAIVSLVLEGDYRHTSQTPLWGQCLASVLPPVPQHPVSQNNPIEDAAPTCPGACTLLKDTRQRHWEK